MQVTEDLPLRYYPEAVSMLLDIHTCHGLENSYMDYWRNHQKAVIVLEHRAKK